MKSSYMKMSFRIAGLLLLISIPGLINKSFSQSVGIGTNTPNSSAQLEIKSNTKGILIPRTSYASRIGILNPAKALLIYDTLYNSFWFHNGTDWIESGRIDPPTGSTFFGFQTGTINLGASNTGIGHQALSVNSSGTLNTAVGYFSLLQNIGGHSNTAVGNNSLRSNNSGTDNTAIGSNSLSNNSNGMRNTAIGKSSLNSNTSGSNNSAIGVEAMYNNIIGYDNTAVGYRSLYNNNTGYTNVAMGTNALGGNISGYANVAIGPGSLNFNNDGFNNVGIGDEALYYQTSGMYNLAVGSKALYNNLTGIENVAIGAHSLYNSNSDNNIAIGYSSLISLTTGNENISIGDNSLGGNVSGSDNVCIGPFTGSQIRTSNNTVIGSGANVGSFSVANATALGYRATVSCNNCMALGGTLANGTQTRVGINNPTPFTDLHIIQQADAAFDNSRGIRLQRPTGGNQWRVFLDQGNNYVFQYNNNVFAYIEPTGGAFISSSDARLKTGINSMPGILDKLMLLQPKTYQYTASIDANRQSYGFLAQDVEKLFPDFVFSSENGIKGIAYSNFSVIAVKAIQEQQQLINEQRQEIDQLKQQMELMLKRMESFDMLRIEKKN